MQELGSIKVMAEYAPMSDVYRVYVVRDVGDRVERAEPGEYGLDWIEVDPAEEFRDGWTWEIPRQIAAALVDELSDHGHRSERDAKLIGTLEATRDHLSDVRQLLGLED